MNLCFIKRGITTSSAGLLLVIATMFGCKSKPEVEVDSIFYNGKVYTSDSSFSIQSAVAIKGDKIVALGNSEDILSVYFSDNSYDLKGKAVYPGFIDAHSHFYGYGKNLQELDLKKTISLEDMIQKTVEYAQSTNPSYILGRGWNEENWTTKGNVSNNKLNLLFPDVPVILQRVDGHAVLCNQAALNLAGINENTVIPGGNIVKMGPFPTGVLVDKAAEKVLELVPDLSLAQKVKALKDAEKACFKAGLTTATDAGLDEETMLLIDSLQRTGELKIRLYVMANPDTAAVSRLLTNSALRENERLRFSAVKLYADGSLGSRGALLKHQYCDDSIAFGLIQHDSSYFKALVSYCYRHDLQVATHCIGDSANKLLLQYYGAELKGKNNRRWRIEHAQVVDTHDYHFFRDYSIIPSVQPTHATSDARMAQKRLCDSPAMTGAYAYKSLLNINGRIAFGTDFPVEDINPIATYFSAVKRKTKHNKVFKPEEIVSPQDALMAMTYWAAYAGFMENDIGSIEVGKKADLTILSEDMMTAYEQGRIHATMTVSDGQIVHSTGLLQPQKQ